MFTIDHTEAIFSFCRQFYNVTLLPITCFDGRTQESRSYPDRFDIGSLARSHPKAFSRFRESPDYWISMSVSPFAWEMSPRPSISPALI